MCGIYGIFNYRNADPIDSDLLERMGRLQIHRGPDDQGAYIGRGVAIGMRRLSIIDLSGGHQPIVNEDQTLWVVCNGEIYNFRELRRMLESKGHRFRTGSDTEVIVHLYEEKGLEFFKLLRGMFALALWDEQRSRLILGRDRLGKKPLYVREEANRLLFASEIKSILEDREIARRVDFSALSEYLALGYVPAPMTLFEGIQKVLPGHYLLVEDGKVSDHEYWEVPFDGTEHLSEREWIEQIQDKFYESVRIRLMSDVPLGAFLSGGIDSSAVVAAIAKATAQPVKTYSIGFEGADSFYNELPYARIVAKAFETDHHEIIVRPNVAELLPRLIWHLDEPLADSAFLTTYLVARLARESVTVILSGVGGDEIFGGYRRYLGLELGRLYRRLPAILRDQWLPALMARLPQDRHSALANYVRYASAFVNSADSEPVSRYISYVTLFSSDARRAIFPNGIATNQRYPVDSDSRTLKQYFDRYRGDDLLNQIMYVDTKTALSDDLLILTDKMTMAASVECRAPFVDHELVELASRMPSSLKVHGWSLKYILKKALASWLPKDILQRKKRGFGAPLGAWIRDPLEMLVKETLLGDRFKKRGLFEPHVVEELIQRHRNREADYTDHLLTLVNFELWCQIFLDGEDRAYLPAQELAGVGQR